MPSFYHSLSAYHSQLLWISSKYIFSNTAFYSDTYPKSKTCHYQSCWRNYLWLLWRYIVNLLFRSLINTDNTTHWIPSLINECKCSICMCNHSICFESTALYSNALCNVQQWVLSSTGDTNFASYRVTFTYIIWTSYLANHAVLSTSASKLFIMNLCDVMCSSERRGWLRGSIPAKHFTT